MAIQLFGREQDEGFSRAKAAEIKMRISEISPALTCSIGIAPNRYLAKIASDMQKPNGLTVIHQHELPERLYSLQLRDFPGIGPRMEERLVGRRCASVKGLCEKTITEMRELWGNKCGEDFWRLIRGEELQERDTSRSSIGHSRVLGPESRNPEKAWSHLIALLSKAAMRLREAQLYAQTLQLHLKLRHSYRGGFDDTHRSFSDHTDPAGVDTAADHWERRARFSETQDTALLLQELSALWGEAPKDRVLRIGVTLGGLISARAHQPSLFESNNRESLMQAFDKLNKKYRKNLVVVAGSSELDQSRQAPIAFGHIPGEGE
jgi:DNA polymerase-4